MFKDVDDRVVKALDLRVRGPEVPGSIPDAAGHS